MGAVAETGYDSPAAFPGSVGLKAFADRVNTIREEARVRRR